MSQSRRIFRALLFVTILVGTLGTNNAASGDRVPAAPTEEQIKAVRVAAARMPADLRRLFEDRFAAWKRTWSEPPLVFSSDPHDATHSKEFHGLVALGREIIPAVVQKLGDPSNFFALQLYDTIQSDRRLVLSSAEDRFEGEQARARKTIQLYASSL